METQVTEAKFLTKLQLEDIDGEEALLLTPLVFASVKLNRILEVPAGMITDFASIPRGLWNIMPKRGKHDKAAVLHDAGYRDIVEMTKSEADSVFLEAMEVSGVGWLSRRLMHRAVRLFGGGAYHQHLKG